MGDLGYDMTRMLLERIVGQNNRKETLYVINQSLLGVALSVPPRLGLIFPSFWSASRPEEKNKVCFGTKTGNLGREPARDSARQQTRSQNRLADLV